MPMISTKPIDARHAYGHIWRVPAVRMLCCLACVLALLASMRVQAQEPSGSCWVPQQVVLDFGTVNPAAGAGPVSSTMTFQCQISTPVEVQVRFCVYIGNDPRSPGYPPRRMVGDVTLSDALQYGLFSDPNAMRPIGPPGTLLPQDTWTITVPASASGTSVFGNFSIYGRVFSGQQNVPADRYQAHPQNSELRYYISEIPQPVAVCNLPAGENAQTVQFQFGTIEARVEETCQLLAASDMDFGQVSSLSGGLDQVSHITLNCPQNMAWQVGLDNGSNAVGTTRRMAGPDGNFIEYELYRDAARTQRWGNTPDDDTSVGTGQGSSVIDLSVYGRIEEQPAAAGGYQDTVTVTLTF